MSETALPDLNELAERIERTLLSDRQNLRRTFNSLRQRARAGQPFDKSLAKLLPDLERAETRLRTRIEQRPKLRYDPALPITGRRDEILTALRDHQVVVICGETGSGKSTQLPKICLEAGRGVQGLIGHTQPRRIAARSVAARIAEELESRVGDAVSFKIRFTDTTSARSLIKLMTDGILLAESQNDPQLWQYDTIIIDEAHERSLNIDFLLGYLKRLLPQRPDLRVIITSATIDAARFAAFFGTAEKPAPVLEVSGRTYPVETRYRPPSEDEAEDDIDWQRAAADACEDLALEGPGDMLVFMPTERDIRETARVLRGRSFGGEPGIEILPLFGRLSEGEQNRVFQSHAGRRIVIATNVAESSLTVPGIRYVIDPGTARISRFSATSQVQRLPVEAVSQASANQRAGRCGRVGPGICVRLYSAEDFATRDAYTQPEILRTNLASVLLQMKAVQLGRIEDFPFLDPPSPTAVRSGLKTLFELNAIDDEEQLTPLGKSMARLPVDPRIARIILAAVDEHCLPEVLVIAAALEQRDPRDRPLDKQKAADEAHKKFRHERSDFLTLLNLWEFYSKLEDDLSTNQLRKACIQNFLSYNRMREWKDLERQLRDIVTEKLDRSDKQKANSPAASGTRSPQKEDAIHRAILSGLLANVAQRGETHEFSGAGGQKLFLWPGSVAFESKPKWIMAAELVETTRRFARTVAPVQPQWIESLAAHLVKRSYSDPHWDQKAAAVLAWEKVLLFGLPIVPRRACRYGTVDPQASRTLFIQHALVQREFESPGEFFKHNAQVKAELEDWQAKLRQGVSFLGDEAEHDFYDQRIPADISDGPNFEKWRKQAELKQPKLLFMSREDLLVDAGTAPKQAAFPDTLRIGTMQVPVEYQLQPGQDHDGVTLVVPREGLNQLSEENLGWLVPGLLEEKVAALIKTLPKALRILFVPVPDTAKEITQKLRYGEGSLLQQLADELRRRSGEHVPVTAFEPARLPDHLRFNVRVVDLAGKTISAGRDLSPLKAESQAHASHSIQEIRDEQWHRDGIKAWTFGTLPAQVQLQRQGLTVVAFPMLVETDAGLSLRLSDSAAQAEQQTRAALVRLFLLSDEKRFTEQVKHFPKIEQITMQAMALPEGKFFRAQLARRMAELTLFRTPEIPRDEAAWNQRLKQARNQVSVAVQDLLNVVPSMIDEIRHVQRLVRQQHPPALQPLVRELDQQLQDLLTPGFLVQAPFVWLSQYPRYFQGMRLRFDKATTGGFQKDRRNQQLVDPHWKKLQGLKSSQAGKVSPLLQQFQYLLEEYRVSLFAQALKTAVPVSEKKLNEAWQAAVREG